MIVIKSLLPLIIYFLVGLGATIVEWGVFYLLNVVSHVHYSLATVLAFAVSTLANWALGRLLLFKKGSHAGLLRELLAIYAVSCIGLAANLGIMWVCIEVIGMHDMFAKMLATAIVFIGNFLVRKFWIYRDK